MVFPPSHSIYRRLILKRSMKCYTKRSRRYILNMLVKTPRPLCVSIRICWWVCDAIESTSRSLILRRWPGKDIKWPSLFFIALTWAEKQNHVEVSTHCFLRFPSCSFSSHKTCLRIRTCTIKEKWKKNHSFFIQRKSKCFCTCSNSYVQIYFYKHCYI